MGGPPEAGLEHFDQVGAHPGVLPHHGADLVGPVGNAVGDVGVRHLVAAVAGERGAVLYAVGRAQWTGRDEEARARDQPLLDSDSESRFQPAAVPDGSVAGLQGVFDYVGDAQGAGATRLGHAPPAEQIVGE